MPTDRQRQDSEHKKHCCLTGWAWNLVSLKKKKQARMGETERGVTEAVEKGWMETKYVFWWLEQRREMRWGMELDGWWRMATQRCEHVLRFGAVKLQAAQNTHGESMQQCVHIFIGSTRQCLDFVLVSFSLHLCFLVIPPDLSVLAGAEISGAQCMT